MYSALLHFKSVFSPVTLVSRVIPKCLPEVTQGNGVPHRVRGGRTRSLIRKARHLVLHLAGLLVECLDGEVHRGLVYFRALMLDLKLSLVCWDCLMCLVGRFDYLLHL